MEHTGWSAGETSGISSMEMSETSSPLQPSPYKRSKVVDLTPAMSVLKQPAAGHREVDAASSASSHVDPAVAQAALELAVLEARVRERELE